MDLNTFFAAASPTTLASLIADLRMLGTGADDDQIRLEVRAYVVLVANCGTEEAERYIESAMAVS